MFIRECTIKEKCRKLSVALLLNILVLSGCSTSSNSTFEYVVNGQMGIGMGSKELEGYYKVLVVSQTQKKYFFRRKNGCEFYVVTNNNIKKNWKYISRKKLCKNETNIFGPW